MSAKNDFVIEQGQTWDYEFLTIFDPCGKLVNLDGYSLAMHIRKTYMGEVVKDLTTDNGGIVLTHGNWLGEWNKLTEYNTGDIVKYLNRFYICKDTNIDEIPYIDCGKLSDYWEVYRQIRFVMTSEDTECIAARKYIYNLEIYDLNTTPRKETKLLYGDFIVKPEVTL